MEQFPSKSGSRISNEQESVQRKFQVSNGYHLEFDQLARILHFLLENRNAKKIPRRVLQEDTGLADRQVGSLVSMGTAMGLIQPGVQILTSIGTLVAEHDIFFEKKSTLEWCHYAGAGSYRNLIWFEIFNSLLAETPPMTQDEWKSHLRRDLAGQYSDKTIRGSLCAEVRFVIDAYLVRNFKKLELLDRSSDGRLYRRRYTGFNPLVLSAMIYDFCAAQKVQLFQVNEMAAMTGSPAVVFGLDAATFRQQIEGLHDCGLLRYETTHNLDQIRLKPSFSAIELLRIHWENQDRHEGSEVKDSRSMDSGPMDSRSKDSEPKDSEPKDSEPKDSEPKDSEPTDSEPKDSKPKDLEPKDSEPKDSKLKSSRPKDSKPKDLEPKDSKLKSSRPKDSKPKDSKPTDSKPKDSKPKDSKQTPGDSSK